MPEWFLPLLLALAFITVAWFVRKLFGLSRRKGRDQRQQCPYCRRWTPRHREWCDWCGRNLGTPAAAELADLAALERQLKRLQKAGVLEPAQVEEVLARVQQHRRRVLEPPSPAPAAAIGSPFLPQPAARTARPPVAPKPPDEPKRAEIITAEVVDLAGEPELVTGGVEPTVRPQPEAMPPSAPVQKEAPIRPAPPVAPELKPPVAPKPSPAPAPKPPRRSWKESLAAFLEERNIRWAELILLVAGLLIVGPSVALVISFWETLEQIPVFKFLIFVAVTSGVFGVGLYAHYRWKLVSTGRALLLIAVLLVPLNFWAMASLSKDDLTLLNVAWEAVSLSIFVYLVGLAAGVLVPGARWFQVVAIVGNSAVVLLVARLTGIASHGGVYVAVGSLPVAVFAGAIGGFLYRTSQSKELDPARAGTLLTLLGTAAFALIVALGLLVARGAEGYGLAATLDRSSALFAIAAAVILAAGLTVVRGTARDVSLAVYHTAGTMIALVGILTMLAALAMAWPQPLAVLAVGTANAAALVFVAFRYRLPIAHGGAIACAVLVYLTGYHVAAGHLELLASGNSSWPMIRLAAGAESAVALIGLVAALGTAAGWLNRREFGRHAKQYAGGCVFVALVSVLAVTAHAVGSSTEARLALIVYAVYGAGCLLMNAWFRKRLWSYVGLGLLVGATIWTLWWQTGVARGQWLAILAAVEAHWGAVLAAEALAMGLAAAVLRRLSGHQNGRGADASRPGSDRNALVDAYRIPLLHVAELVAPVALAIGVWTAWADRAAIHWSLVPVVTATCAAALYLLLAWGYRSVVRTWVGSMVALAGVVHTLVWNYQGWLGQPWPDALLAHATAAALASSVLGLWARRGPRARLADEIHRVFIRPLGETALLSSALALAVCAVVSWADSLWLAVCLFWLAAIWLTIAWTRRWPAMLAASQAVLTAAVVTATTAWLQRHPWGPGAKVDLLDPRSLQAYGIGLGLLTLAWIVARIALRRNAVAQQLLNPDWPAVDRIVGHAVVAVQLFLVAVHLLPGCWQELSKGAAGAAAAGSLPEAFGPTGWLLVAVLALGLLVALWHRWGKAELASSLLLAASVPCLVAGQFAGDRATASALRWGLAICLMVCAAAVWQRRRLHDWWGRLGAVIDAGPHGPRTSRAVLLAVTVGPVLVVTLLAALLRIAGVSPGGPAQGSFFRQIGPELSYLVPLVLVMAGLVGFALRETSAGYAFSAGLVAKMTVALGYLLSVAKSGNAIGTDELVTVLQLLTITAAVWGVTWLAARRAVAVWREGAGPGPARTLMNVQLGMGIAGNTLLWIPALFALVFYPASWHGWTIAAGSGLGWVALLSVVAAVVYRQIQAGRPVQPDVAGLVGMAALGLLACTIRGVVQFDPEWGYRTLMLGWAAYALFVALVTWWVATIRTLPDAKGPPQALIRAAAAWVSGAGVSAVLLGLKAALLHKRSEDLLWAAGAIAVASAAGAAMSVWRRREGWAFAAAPGVNLAASLAVWYGQYTLPFAQWWVLLVEANVIASASVALLWLAARRRLYELRELTIRSSPLLGAQTALGVVGTVLLLLLPVVSLLHTPERLPGWAAQLAQAPGWIALLLAGAAAAWYLRQVWPEKLFHAVGGLGLSVGVALTCGTGAQAGPVQLGDWSAYHTLTTSWAAAGLVVLAIGLLGRNLRLARQRDPSHRLEDSMGRSVFPGMLVGKWVTAIGAATLALALIYCLEDPGRPWWSVRAILAASVMAGLLAMWLRLPGYVYVSGLLVNVAGTVMWLVWGSQSAAGFVHVNALCFAIVSCVWSLVRLTHAQGVPAFRPGGRQLTPAHLALQTGLAALAVVVAVSAVHHVTGMQDLLGNHDPATGRLGWLALSALAAAAAICLWDRSARFPLQALYWAGLIAVGMGLNARELSPRVFCWTAGHELAAFVLLCAVLGVLLPRMRPVWQALRIEDLERRQARHRFPEAQAVVAGVAVALCVWISIDFAFDEISHPAIAWISGRTAGPLAATALLAAAILTAGQLSGRWRFGWQWAAFGLAALVLAGTGWAWLSPDWLQRTGASAWLHRNVILLGAAVVTGGVAGFGLRRIVPAGSDWITSGRRVAPVLGGVALLLLAAALVQEAVLFEAPDGTPMAPAAIVVVAAALVAMTAAGICMAVLPRLDPLGLSLRGRTAYVYAAEVLFGLLGLHVRLTMAWLFRLGLMRQYWMLLVMFVAFVGAGLSELFRRRRMPVLSQPLERTALLLPLAPAIGFWFAPQTGHALGLAGSSAAVWFLAALFYGFQATTRRSVIFGALSALAANTGLWVLWHQVGWGFLEHPQLWLVPIALAALVAEYLNHDRLTRAQSAGLRYLALSVIYVSSTTEFLVINKIGESLVLPLVLVFLSLLGILSGIVLRIRSYVYLGVTFLLVVIVTMIWHAAVDQRQTWVFYLSCIALGLGIFAVFALYEKHRDRILAGMAQFRQWEQ